MDGGHAPADADGFRQRLQREPRYRRAQARHHRVGHGVARLPFLPQRGPAAGLDGVEAGIAVHAEIVLGVAGADHDVAHAQRRIEAARHAAHQERAAVEAIEQQRGRHAGIDLAGARFDENRLAAGDLAAPEGEPADFLRLRPSGRRDGRTPRAGPI